MLRRFITINGEQMPNPVGGTFVDNYVPSENVYESESGKQLSNVIRLDRYTWTAQFNCTSRIKKKLMTFCKTAQVECSINGEQYIGRLRTSSGNTLAEGTEYTQGTDGLWTVAVVFEEE